MQQTIALLCLAIFSLSGLSTSTDEYIYKAKNLKPQDYGIDAGNWEGALSILNRRLDNDARDTDALFLRAIAYREMGIRRALVLRTRDWKRSTNDFEMVLARDSLYRDVLFQYGLLKQYKKEFDSAFDLMHRQQSVKPAEGYVEAALFRLYRYFFIEHSPSDLEKWYDEHPSDYTRYFQAEMRRKSGDSKEANTMFQVLLEGTLDIPVQPVLLSRARLYYALKRPDIAQSYVYQAIDAIDDEISARLFLEDFKYILSDDEIEQYTVLEQPAAFRSFFHNILEKRNPTRADDIDLRLQVHYERLIEAEQLYAQYGPREAFQVIRKTQANQTADRDFPRAYWLNGELGDRGLIYIRHGKPNDVAASVTESTDYIESWRYLNPELVFHFEGHSGLGVLIPLLPANIEVLEAREIWGGTYALLSQSLRAKLGSAGTSRSRTYDLDIINFSNELFDQAIKDVGSGLTTDRYAWPGDLKHLDLPYLVSSFRTDDRKTLVQIHFGIPIGEALAEADPIPERISLDVGYAVHDTLWNALHKERAPRTLSLLAVDKADSAVDLIQFIAPVDSYHVNLHVGIEEVSRKGSYLFGYQVPDYSSDELLISDIIPARHISPADEDSRFTKHGLQIIANPGRGFFKKDPLVLYYEVYNLTYGADDQTAYSIRYTLEERKKNRRMFRRKSNTALSVTVNRTGAERRAIEYGELDVSSLKKGAYDLRVTITDTHTGRDVTTYREIELR